jgi:hypothetical protein
MAAISGNQVGNVGGVAASGGEVAAAFGMARPSELIAATVAAEQWMPVKAAAREAGVPERSAFRWARKGVVPVQRRGRVQLVEVAALRAYASRPVNGRGVSTAEACGGATAAAPVTELQSADEAARVADWEERLSTLEMVMEDVWMAVFGRRS